MFFFNFKGKIVIKQNTIAQLKNIGKQRIIFFIDSKFICTKIHTNAKINKSLKGVGFLPARILHIMQK